jgi:chromosome condensin MukBEF MukE localization factor
MEHQNQETFLKLSTYNFERFAEADNLLRSGMHIQNHKSQRRIYDFIEDNIEPLKSFYERLYKAKLNEQPTVDNKYFYLDGTEAQNKILNKVKLDQEATLFAIFLYWLHKVEKQFSFNLTKAEIVEMLNTNHRIKQPIQKIFFGTDKEDTISIQKHWRNGLAIV